MEAAHFCYLMAHVPFGHYTVKTDHLALLGSSHRYVTFWGEGTFSRGLFQSLLSFTAPFLIFSCESELPPVPSSGVFGRGLGKELAHGCSSHRRGLCGKQRPVGVLCASGHLVTPWLHDQGLSLIHVSVRALPLACCLALGSPGQNWKVEEVCLASAPLP